MPAMREARGLPRLNAIMRLWLLRAREVELRQGCIYCAGAFEYDDRPGPVRDRLLEGVMRWRAALKRTVIQAIDAGHLEADTEAEQLVFEMDALFTGLMRDARFLRRHARSGPRLDGVAALAAGLAGTRRGDRFARPRRLRRCSGLPSSPAALNVRECRRIFDFEPNFARSCDESIRLILHWRLP